MSYKHQLVEEKVGAFYFEHPTPLTVAKQLNHAYDAEAPIRVWYGNEEKPDWGEENDVMGYVGRSTGQNAIPLIIGVTIGKGRNYGGPALLTSSITRMMRRSKEGNWREVYRAPFYKEPNFTLVTEAVEDGYAAEVTVNGETHARFWEVDEAIQWIDYMKGKAFPIRFMYQENEDLLDSEDW